VQIDKNVAVPEPNFRNRRAFIPWPTLGVGDSVFFNAAFLAKRSRTWLANQAWQANRRYKDRAFIARLVDGGGRIWRVR
jgi:hypothetical protein